MEKEANIKFAFLDVLVLRSDGGLAHREYHKPMHTDRYMHHGLNHHPRQKHAEKVLVNWASRVFVSPNLAGELKHLDDVLQANG